MFKPLDGRSVVVTGATRGIGKGIARVFTRAGTRVLVVGRDEQAARSTVDELSQDGEVSYVLADISRRAECERGRGHGGRAPRGHRRALRERGHLPGPSPRRHDRGRDRRGDGDEPQGLHALRSGLHSGARALRPRSCDPHVVDHRSDHGLPRLGPLRRQQGRPAGLHEDGGDRARPARRHRQRHPAGQHRVGGTRRARRRLRRRDDGVESPSASWARSRTSAIWRCSSRPTRPGTSPARRSWWTAARCCPSRWRHWKALELGGLQRRSPGRAQCRTTSGARCWRASTPGTCDPVSGSVRSGISRRPSA